MLREPLSLALARRVKSVLFQRYVRDLGWVESVPRPNEVLALFHAPNAPLRQVLVPFDEGVIDYGEAVLQGVRQLAHELNRSPQQILDELLLSPADLLEWSVVDATSAPLELPLAFACELLAGIGRILLAVAQGQLPAECQEFAEEFVASCHLTRSHQVGLAFRVSCPLAAGSQSAEQSLATPFGRRVSQRLMQALETLAQAARSQNGQAAPELGLPPLTAADFCRTLAALRPPGQQQSLIVNATWSPQRPLNGTAVANQVVLTGSVFALADHLGLAKQQETAQPAGHLGLHHP